MIHELQKKIGQLMVFGFSGKKVTPELEALIRSYHVGGIILFSRNIGSTKEVLQLTTDLQKIAYDAGHDKPLFICIDQENGVVRRLEDGVTLLPGQMAIGATGKPKNAYVSGLITGKELKALGINWNLAPVLDVNNNPNNPVIGVRSYGETPEMVSEFGKQAVKGMQEAGVITTLKHFPGHGDTNVDSHLDLPVITHGMDRLKEVELKPFMDVIEQGADVIMSAHVYFPTIEDQENVPATLSKRVITDLLRKELGFTGVVTTDCMEMNAISETIGTPAGGVKALQAGVDLIMVSHLESRQKDTISAIIEAVKTGDINEETINSAYERVMNLKEKYLKWEDVPLHTPLTLSTEIESVSHLEKAEELYNQGITIVNNDGILPLSKDKENSILVISPKNNSLTQVEDKGVLSTRSFGESIKDLHKNTDIIELSNPPTKEEVEKVSSSVESYKTVIIGTINVKPDDSQVKLVQAINRLHNSVIVVATRNPYDLAYIPRVSATVAMYERTTPASNALANALFGKIPWQGKLPVTLPN